MIDFFDTEDLLGETERLVRDTVREFVDEQVLPHIGDWCVEGKFPEHLIAPMAEMGLLGAALP